MLKQFRGDLHIHTCLSPCADLTMSPKRVVEKAAEKKLDFIAICDHNSAENVRAAVKAGLRSKVKVLPGMEVTTIEEVHILALFAEAGQALTLQEKVYETLPDEENKEEIFGEQIIANEFDEVEGFNKRLLLSATTFPVKELVRQIHEIGGLAIAAHVDREAYSIIGQLGFIPEDLELDALEISANTTHASARDRFPGIEKFPLLSSSDAHYLEDIGKIHTSFLLAEPGLAEIRSALREEQGRKIAAGV